MSTIFCRFATGMGMHNCFDTIVLDEAGRFRPHERLAIESRLSPAELAEYKASNAEGEAYEKMCAQAGWDEQSEPMPRFATIEDCLAYCDARDAYDSVEADLSLFNAPSECYKGAWRGADAKLHAAESKAVVWLPNNPITEAA